MAGDDQASTIYTALANLEDSVDDADAAAAAGAAAGAASGTPAATAEAAAEQQAGVPHRWRVVGMMALSFVLCNMDKVRHGGRQRRGGDGPAAHLTALLLPACAVLAAVPARRAALPLQDLRPPQPALPATTSTCTRSSRTATHRCPQVNMSVAVIPMAKELGWTAMERGLVSSSFFWGYSLTQIPAGWVSTR